MRDVYVVGVHTIRFGKYLDLSIKDLARQTVEGCMMDSGLMKKDIQATRAGANLASPAFAARWH
jgi:acetyl-CoA acetyltransferase